MFDWLFEGRLLVYVVLVLVGLAFLFFWYRDSRRRRFWLYPVALMVLLAGVYFLLDRLVETRREQIGRKLQEMAVAVKKGDVSRIFEHISDQFRLGGLNKAAFRKSVEGYLNRGEVDDLEIWNVQFLDDEGRVAFHAKPKGRLPGTDAFYLVRAQFVLENGQWRLHSFQVFNPYSDSNTPLDIPYLSGG
jgi:hypothetical protein